MVNLRAQTQLATAAILLVTAPISAATELTRLTPGDAVADHRFGYSVHHSGTTAIVGAYGDNHAGQLSGSAYLFNTASGDQLLKLTAADTQAGDAFGFSVAIHGNTAIVGAYNDNNTTSKSGSAYLFDVTTGNQLFKLTALDGTADDFLGYSVAIHGATAVVGAVNDGFGTGSVYLFDVTTGNQVRKLVASDNAAGDNFGYSVAIDGNIAIIGARGNDDAGSDSGSAYLFDVTTGKQLGKLTATATAAGDFLGYSVAISGNTAVIGAFGDDDDGNSSGSAYIFDITTRTQLAKFTASDVGVGDQFGYAVSIDGTTVVIGARFDDDDGFDSGSAYLFDIGDRTNPIELAKLTTSDAAGSDRFGSSVSIAGATALVGAFGKSDAGSGSGAAYLFNAVAPSTPEPASLALLTLGILCLAARRDRVA